MNKMHNAINILEKYNQEHIIKLLEELGEKEQKELIDQIERIDFQQISELYKNTKKEI